MPVVQFKRTAHAQQVEGFPATVLTDEKVAAGLEPKTRKFARSVEGALHLRPGGTLVLTADEYEWLKANRKPLFKELLFLAEDPKEESVKVESKKEAPKAPPSNTPPAA